MSYAGTIGAAQTAILEKAFHDGMFLSTSGQERDSALRLADRGYLTRNRLDPKGADKFYLSDKGRRWVLYGRFGLDFDIMAAVARLDRREARMARCAA